MSETTIAEAILTLRPIVKTLPGNPGIFIVGGVGEDGPFQMFDVSVDKGHQEEADAVLPDQHLGFRIRVSERAEPIRYMYQRDYRDRNR